MSIDFKNIKGSFRTKPNGKIEYRIYVNGTSKSFSGNTEAECKRKCREYIQQLNEEETDKETKMLHTTVEEIAEYWLNNFKFGTVSNSTYDRLECAFNNHIKGSVFGSIELSNLTVDDVQNFFNEKKQTLSLSSLKKLKEVLYPTFKYALVKELIKYNPCDFINFPKNDKSLPVKTKIIECYTAKEIERITATSTYPYFKKNSRRYRYAPMFAFILNTGLRLGECLALTWNDIDFVKKTITVNKSVTYEINRNKEKSEDKRCKIQVLTPTKTEKSVRIIPLNSAASDLLSEMKVRNSLNKHSSNIIFYSPLDGSYLDSRSVQTTFQAICKDIGVEYKGIHALRHTFGSILVQHGTDIKVVSELLGHTDVKFTYNRYIHIIHKQKAEALDIMNITPLLKNLA